MGDGPESRRHALDPISVRHPHDGGAALPDAFEEVTGIIDHEFGTAIFPVFGLGHIAPGEMRDELHAITDTEDRDALIEELLSRRSAPSFRTRSKARRKGRCLEDDRLKSSREDTVQGRICE